MNTALIRPAAKVTVTAPARLHLGFLDLNGRLGRRFGSIGLAISGLKTQISVAPTEHMRVSGPEADRVRRYVDLMQNALALDGAYDVKVEELVPSHAGFGSGTQLALAVGAALQFALAKSTVGSTVQDPPCADLSSAAHAVYVAPAAALE